MNLKWLTVDIVVAGIMLFLLLCMFLWWMLLPLRRRCGQLPPGWRPPINRRKS